MRLTVGRSVGKTFEAFDTYFDDGSCLMTWMATPALTVLSLVLVSAFALTILVKIVLGLAHSH